MVAQRRFESVAHDHVRAVVERDEARVQLARYEAVVSAALRWREADLDLDDLHEGRPLLDALADACDALNDGGGR